MVFNVSPLQVFNKGRWDDICARQLAPGVAEKVLAEKTVPDPDLPGLGQYFCIACRHAGPLAPRAAAAWPFPVPARQRWQHGAHPVLRAPPPQQVLHLRPGAGRPPEDAEAQARRNRVSTQAQPPSSLISRRALRRRTKTLTTEKIYDHAEANAGAGRGSIDNSLQEREGMAVK